MTPHQTFLIAPQSRLAKATQASEWFSGSLSALLIIVFALVSTSCLSIIPALAPKVDAEKNISAAFPFESKYVDVLDSKMHYIEVGEGAPIVLMHGNPTSSYLWRNVIPHLKAEGRRVIALDLIGMGKSGKPDIGYRLEDHARYFDAFVDALELKDITLVLHDWGGGVGFDYAMRHQENIRAIALMETLVRPADEELSGSGKIIFDTLRGPKGEKLVLEENYFIEKLLPAFSGRTLTKEEMAAYRAPYLKAKDRKPTLVWPREAPLPSGPADVRKRVSNTYEKLRKSDVPLLLLTAEPGGIIPAELAKSLSEDLPRMKVQKIGAGLHFIQETQPTRIGKAIDAWLKTQRAAKAPEMASDTEATISK